MLPKPKQLTGLDQTEKQDRWYGIGLQLKAHDKCHTSAAWPPNLNGSQRP